MTFISISHRQILAYNVQLTAFTHFGCHGCTVPFHVGGLYSDMNDVIRSGALAASRHNFLSWKLHCVPFSVYQLLLCAMSDWANFGGSDKQASQKVYTCVTYDQRLQPVHVRNVHV